ncbi:MAG: winged helix-turn-helix transcriptional regulator [Deltaproteobacteria bacterium]|nr:winged helix-turn-helix transcriptional regulator [Deltaproteobacteria bacterium]
MYQSSSSACSNHSGRILNRETILASVWKNTDVSDRVVDSHISLLRKKLADFDHEFVAVYGAGYGIKPR